MHYINQCGSKKLLLLLICLCFWVFKCLRVCRSCSYHSREVKLISCECVQCAGEMKWCRCSVMSNERLLYEDWWCVVTPEVVQRELMRLRVFKWQKLHIIFCSRPVNMDLNRYKFIYRNRLCTVGANCKNNNDLLSTVSVLVFGVYDRYMIPMCETWKTSVLLDIY